MKFQKFLFGCSLNGLSVAKYTDITDITPFGVKVGEERSIQLSVEKDGHAVSGFDSRFFFGSSEEEAQDGFRNWIESIVTDADAIYNKAAALGCVIDALRNDAHYIRQFD